MKPKFLSLVFLLLSVLTVIAEPTAGEIAYAQGDYASAVEQWQEQGHRDGLTAPLLSALGNAEWKLGRKGRAVICWERALLLDPRDTVAIAGLRHAQTAGGIERPTATWSENYSAFLRADTWLILAGISFWGMVLCVALPMFSPKNKGAWYQRGLVTFATLLALSLPGLWGSHTYAQRAVVRRADVALRLTPTAQGEPVSGIGEGDIVRTERGFNGHTRVQTTEGKTGWVRNGEVEAIWGGGLPANLDQKATP